MTLSFAKGEIPGVVGESGAGKSTIANAVIGLPDPPGRFAAVEVYLQGQRISIARALATRPRFLICDEPTGALDVSIQARIFNLLKDLLEELVLTMLFISYDLPVIRQTCNRVGVLRKGEVLEIAETEALFEAPQHDYTRRLLSLMPKPEGLAAGE